MVIPRLIVAPVGKQVAAVLAPLMSPGCRPVSGDRLLLLASEETGESAKGIPRMLDLEEAAARIVPAEPRMPLPGALYDEARSALEKGSEVHLLLNGGAGEWMYELVWLLAELAGDRLRLVESTGLWGRIRQRDGNVDKFEVVDMGEARLRAVIGVCFDEHRGELSHEGGAALEGVVKCLERAGHLFAHVDVSRWPIPAGQDKNKAQLAAYRKLLNWRCLQSLGLEGRRILLTGAKGMLRLRALQDGIPTAGSYVDAWERELHEAEWTNRVRSFDAPDLPELLDRRSIPNPLEYKYTGRAWVGPTLIILMGSQPGATLRAIWAHAPQHLVLLCDGASPLVRRACFRLQRDPALGCLTVRCLRFQGRRGLREALDEVGDLHCDGKLGSDRRPIRLELTPGTKLMRAELLLFARAAPEKRELWRLAGVSVKRWRPDDTGGPEEGRVPTQTWLSQHAPGRVKREGPLWTPHAAVSSTQSEIVEMCTQLALHVNSLPHTHGLSELWKARNGRAYFDESCGRLTIPSHNGYDLTRLAGEADCAELASSFSPIVKNGKKLPNGRWLEWVVAARLARAGMDEVLVSVRTRWPGAEADTRFRDDLDVVSAHAGLYTLWSCKVTSNPGLLGPALFEARAQADRFLGRLEAAVVVVPRLPNQVPDDLAARLPAVEQDPVRKGCWWVPEAGAVVDLRVLVDTEAVMRLAMQLPGWVVGRRRDTRG